VNNAGVGIRDSVADMQSSAVRGLFETNFFGLIACLQAVVPAMRKAGGGDIINISSVAGHLPVPFMALYSASKFAVNALGKSARLELRRDNINVLTVCPGYVATEFGAHLVANRKGNVRPRSVRGITAERVARAAFRGLSRQEARGGRAVDHDSCDQAVSAVSGSGGVGDGLAMKNSRR